MAEKVLTRERAQEAVDAAKRGGMETVRQYGFYSVTFERIWQKSYINNAIEHDKDKWRLQGDAKDTGIMPSYEANDVSNEPSARAYLFPGARVTVIL